MSAPAARLNDRDSIQDWARTCEEYEFMRSFGMTHARACERIGVPVATFDRAAFRHGYSTI